MNEVYYISVKNKQLVFSVCIKGKYTVIAGDSAIGKTTLCEFLSGAEQSLVGYECSTDLKYHVVGVNDSLEAINSNDFDLLVIDESAKILHLSNTATILQQMNCYFLIVSRVIPKFLPLGIQNLYTLENGTAVQLYRQVNQKSFYGVKAIITEDSDAGLEFFRENFDVPVESAFGNGNLFNKLSEYSDLSKVLVVFDAAAIVPFAKKLYRKIERNNTLVLDWYSFENYVLSQEPISLDVSSCSCNFESLEQYSTYLLKSKMEYDKGKLPDYLKRNKNIDLCIQSENKFCSVF